MKLSASKVDGFVRAPDSAVWAILVYGPDSGLVRERADALARHVVEDIADPFRVADLGPNHLKEDPARLHDEACAIAMTGGRRLVRLRPASDQQADIITAYFADPLGEALIIVEAGELPPRSKLRKAFESPKFSMALPCYPDEGHALGGLIADTAKSLGLEIEREAMAYLVAALGGDRLMTRTEIEKLALYVGDERPVTLAHAQACVGDSSLLTLDAIAIATAGGDIAGLERGLARAYLEGANPIPVLRASARHLQRLHITAGARAQGLSADRAIKTLRPPVHFKMEKEILRQSPSWSVGRVAQAMEILLDAERDCKTTGLPGEAVCSRALMRVAWAARAARR